MRRRLGWIVYGLAAAALAGVIVFGASADWPVERTLRWIRGTGWAALVALALSLCATPLGRALGRHPRGPASGTTTRLRRALGVSAAALAAAHLTLASVTVLSASLGRVLEVPWLRAGATAALVLLALWVTSYPSLVKALRVRAWKPLHRLAYVAGALALWHALGSPMSDPAWIVVVGGIVVAVAPLRLLPPRRAAPAERRVRR